MKRERHGRAKILTPDEIQLLVNSGLESFSDLQTEPTTQDAFWADGKEVSP